jgi:hypothetical protein
MKIKNPFVANHWTVGRVILVLWFLFATVFVFYSAWGALNNVIFQQGVQRGALLGQNDTINRVIQLSQNCNTVSLFSGEGDARVEVGLVNSECSAAQVKAARDAASAQPAATMPTVTPPVVTPPVVEETPSVSAEMPVQE